MVTVTSVYADPPSAVLADTTSSAGSWPRATSVAIRLTSASAIVIGLLRGGFCGTVRVRGRRTHGFTDDLRRVRAQCSSTALRRRATRTKGREVSLWKLLADRA